MEYLDYYDEDMNYLGKEERGIVHRDALWHKTVHCWLYDKYGNIYFQIRKDEGTLYTTASGHVLAGETVKDAFYREVKEEIGIDVNIENATLVEINKFTLDKVKKDGTVFRDRAFANVYVCDFEQAPSTFSMDPEEVQGLAKVNASEVLDLFNGKVEIISGTKININDEEEKQDFIISDFLVNNGETLLGKYGKILNKVKDITQNIGGEDEK